MKKVELLAPAGSFDAMRAAVNAGADAVYMGGSHFGARAYADNPDEDGLIRAIEFCHLRGKKLYLTVNTLFKEDELSGSLKDFLKPYYEAGLDAVIVQDAGAVKYIGRHFPGLDIHLSTQCTITMAEGAEGFIDNVSGFCTEMADDSPDGAYTREKGASLPITRLVPARELSLEELIEMRQKTKLEIEVFVHGALCFCYSGQCLLSSMAGGRSGNRGRCAQPCRRLYSACGLRDARGGFGNIQGKSDSAAKQNKGYFLSPKDMCALPYIHKMIDAGIDSFKIEGRMKSPEYVAGVVAEYRSYIDRYYELGSEGYERWLEKEVSELEKSVDRLRGLYNRGGFNDGYLFEHNGQDMMSLTRPNHSGVKVGEVVQCEGRKAFIRLSVPVEKGDVLEIRNSQGNIAKALYEFTAGEGYASGVRFSILTMKDRTAAAGMEVYRTKNIRLLDEINRKYLLSDARLPIRMYFLAAPGREMELRLSTEGGNSVVVKGNIPDNAQNAPTTAETAVKQLKKLGDTEFDALSVEADISENLFIPVGELNRMRRSAVEKLRNDILSFFLRPSTDTQEDAGTERNGEDKPEKGITGDGTMNKICALASTAEQLRMILRYDFIDTVYFDISGYKYGTDFSVFDEISELCSVKGKKLMFALPAILRDRNLKRLEVFIRHYRGKAGYLVRNREEYETVKRCIGEISLTDVSGPSLLQADYHIYVTNSMAGKCIDLNYTVSPELNAFELGSVAGDRAQMIIYGLLPVMLSAQCVYKNVYGKCTSGDMVLLTDEKGYRFPTKQLCGDCCNIIYNSSVLNLLHRLEEVKGIGFGSLRLNFTFESGTETGMVLDCLYNVLNGKKYIMPEEIMGLKFTNGHFTRGVE